MFKKKKMIKKNFNSNYLIISFSKDFYKFHYTLTLASSLRAINKNVTVFISGYACNFIKKKWHSNDEQNIHKKLEQKNMGSIEEIFSYCKELEVKIFYCETALEFLNIASTDIINLIDIKPISMHSILNLNKENEILFI